MANFFAFGFNSEISLDNEYPRHPVNVFFVPYSLQMASFKEEKENACTWEEGNKAIRSIFFIMGNNIIF